jgi:hypothetical protein
MLSWVLNCAQCGDLLIRKHSSYLAFEPVWQGGCICSGTSGTEQTHQLKITRLLCRRGSCTRIVDAGVILLVPLVVVVCAALCLLLVLVGTLSFGRMALMC